LALGAYESIIKDNNKFVKCQNILKKSHVYSMSAHKILEKNILCRLCKDEKNCHVNRHVGALKFILFLHGT
jgi:hypothetical protein